MEHTKQDVPHGPGTTSPAIPVLAPALMMVFWMLLGASAGIKVMQSMWHLLGLGGGEMSIAVPVGAVIGALVGVLLGLIRNPKYLVLVMAAFAASAAGGVAGGLPWGTVGEVGGQLAGGLVGAMAWAAWLFFGRGQEATFGVNTVPSRGNELQAPLRQPALNGSAKSGSSVRERESNKSAGPKDLPRTMHGETIAETAPPQGRSR